MDRMHGALPLLFGGEVLQPFPANAQGRSAQSSRRRRGAQASLCILKSCVEAGETSAGVHKPVKG